ncbi:MAG: DUF1800 family protein [Gammaproteobacteria bacterium]
MTLIALALASCGGGGGSSGPPPATAPGAPTIGTASPFDKTLSVSFTPPASNGGAAISSFTVTCTAGSEVKTASGASSPLSVSGLTNNTAYSCSVTATNSAGTSPASASVTGTPVPQPKPLSATPILGGFSAGATVDLFRADTGERIESKTTGSDGTISVSVPASYTGLAIVRVSGSGSALYLDERTDTLKPFTANQFLLAVIPPGAMREQGVPLAVSTLTHAIALAAGINTTASAATIAAPSLTDAALQSAQNRVMDALGLTTTALDPLKVPVYLKASDQGKGTKLEGSGESLNYGVILIALAKLAPSGTDLATFAQTLGTAIKNGTLAAGVPQIAELPQQVNSAKTGFVSSGSQSQVTVAPEPILVKTSVGPGGTLSPESVSARKGTSVKFTLSASTGYELDTISGCAGTLSGVEYTTGSLSAACTVTAAFKLKKYTVTASAGTGGSISPTSSSIEHGSRGTFTLTASAGYAIASASGCSGSLSGSAYTTSPITGACEVTASFIETFVVTASAGAGGSISPSTVAVIRGSTTNFAVTASPGFEIAGVSGCAGTLSGTSYTTGPISAPCSVNASFRLKKYTVSTTTATGGTVSPASAVVEHGSTTTFTLTAASGFTLIEAKGCGGTLSGGVFTTAAITGACTVEPTFVPNVELTLSISNSVTRVGDDATLTWSAKNSTGCVSTGSWTGSRATEGTFSIPARTPGQFAYSLECTGRGAGAKKSVSLVVPVPVFATSYENKNSLTFEGTQVPSVRTLGIRMDSDEQDSNERSVTFGDFFQEGRISAFVSVRRSKNLYGIKDFSDTAGKSYFLAQDDRGVWTDRTAELLPNAADRDTCVTTSNAITADFNNDLKPDVFVSCEGLQSNSELPTPDSSDPKYAERYLVNQLLYLSTAGKTYRRIELPFKLKATFASSADIDGDRKIDVVLANISSVPNEAGMVVLLGNGDGSFRRNDSVIPRTTPTGRRIDDIGWIYYAQLVPIEGRLDLIAISGRSAAWIKGASNGFDLWTLKRVDSPVSPRTGGWYWMTDVVRAGGEFKFVGGSCTPDNCTEFEMSILKTDFDSRAFSIYPVVVSARNAFQAASNHVKLNSDGSLVAYTGWCQTPPAGVCKLRILPDGLQTLSDIDVLRYIASYPELIESLGADIAKGRVHYEQTGAREGRRITFDPATYVASHPDLINSIGVNEEQATRHYITTGYRERRSASSFDALRYTASHGDVLTTFGFDTYSTTKNYILYGYQDGRRTTFDGLAYIASYGDLIDSIKTDVVAGIQHFIRYGFAEGRRVTFDVLAYVASTGERIARFGTDVVAAARYYIEVGFKAGEKVTFSALAYLANNADLRTRFNGDLAAATRHFISTGFAEKRSASAFPNSPLTRLEAHRFLIQTTFGPTDADIKRLLEYGYAPNGYERWIDAEIAKPVSLMLPALIALVPADTQGMGASIMQQDRVDLWFRKVMREDDQLRQRVAWALSEILVVSDNGALLEFPFAIADFQDMLGRNAFGNYRKLLEDVTLHPAMGMYLSMLGNQRAVQGTNLRPDENYAREMMQLFSIGLVELNIDGTVRRDGSGQPIPTYNQETIAGFARVFTGWGWGCPGYVLNSGRTCNQGDWRGFDAWPVSNFNSAKPMEFYSDYHEDGTKKILNYPGIALPGGVIPASQGGVRDLKDALDNVFNHPNVGPFISKQLIQKLVTSNPSPAYVQRVAEKFNNDGRGTRGNLEAVIKAILLDSEARDVSNSQTAGKVKEPLLRLTQLWRAYGASSPSGKIGTQSFCCPVAGSSPVHIFGQSPGQSPSVFNFFSPSYSPPGEIAQAGLVAPELQLANENLHTQMGWFFFVQTNYRTNRFNGTQDPKTMFINIDEEMRLADDVDALIDRAAEKLLGGSSAMTPALREKTREQLRLWQIDPTFTGPNRTSHLDNMRQNRVSDALYLIVMSPEFAVQR